MNARRAIATTAFASMVWTLAGCAIQADSGPRDIPADDDARGAIESSAEGGEATGEGRIYLLAPNGGEQVLRTVLRNSKDLLQQLVQGPNQQEVSAGLSTEVPPTIVINDVRFDGSVYVVDISDGINELTGANLRLAVAQIVFTASEIPGTESVAIRVDGQSQSWPNGDGIPISRPLTAYDFVGFAESSQPAYPVTPRNPSSAAAETTTTAVAATTSVPAVTAPGETTTTMLPGESTTIAPTTG